MNINQFIDSLVRPLFFNTDSIKNYQKIRLKIMLIFSVIILFVVSLTYLNSQFNYIQNLSQQPDCLFLGIILACLLGFALCFILPFITLTLGVFVYELVKTPKLLDKYSKDGFFIEVIRNNHYNATKKYLIKDLNFLLFSSDYERIFDRPTTIEEQKQLVEILNNNGICNTYIESEFQNILNNKNNLIISVSDLIDIVFRLNITTKDEQKEKTINDIVKKIID